MPPERFATSFTLASRKFDPSRLLQFGLWAGLAGVLVLQSGPSRAQTVGITPPGMPPPDRPWQPPDRVAPHPIITRNLSLLKYQAAISITNGMATTRVTLDFRNDTPSTLEGDFVFPVPAGAILSDFALRDGDQRLKPELLEAEHARQWYLDIVRQAIDPGLLEYVNQSAYRVRAFPFTAGQTRSIEMSFTHQLPSRGSLRHYTLPLQFAAPNVNLIRNLQMMPEPAGRAANAIAPVPRMPAPMPPPAATFVATVELNDTTGLGAITCPTHGLSLSREGAQKAHGSVEGTITPSAGTFELLIGRASEEFAASMIAYPGERGEDGYFTLTIYPSTRGISQVLPKNVVLVLDTSGSMDGEKWQQARDALQYVVDHLGPEDKLSLIDYDDLVNEAWRGFKPASATVRQEARSYLASLSADGGTNIYDALRRGSQTIAGNSRDGRPEYLLFFTDGLPTVGQTDPASILGMMESSLPAHVRLFTFGVGYDVNTQLLNSLARNHRGASDYVEPNQSIESVVSAFYQKIQHPALTDVAIDWGGLQVYDLMPNQSVDLFHGTQLTLAGRYRGTPPANLTLRLSGKAGNQSKTIPLTVPSQPSREANFVPRLWANFRVARLLEQLQAQPGNAELLEQVRSLAMRFGIVTPYTSYLVREDLRFTSEGQRDVLMERAAPAPVSGYGAVQKSQSLNRRSDQAQLGGSGGGAWNAVADEEIADEDKAAYEANKQGPTVEGQPPAVANALPAQFMNQLGNLTFLQAGIGMVDSRYDPAGNIRVVQVAAFSDRYLALLKAVPNLGRLLSQSAEVTVMVGPDLVLQTVLTDARQQPVSESQVNVLRTQSGDKSPAGYRSASDQEWQELIAALKTGYFEG